MMEDDAKIEKSEGSRFWLATKAVCLAVLVISVLSCVILAAMRSKGLTQVTVTALDAKLEPRDHDIPLVKQSDALPDYEVVLKLHDGQSLRLGARPNTSAIDGLTWKLSEPVSVMEIAGVRLQDQDKLVSDAITEVQIQEEPIVSGNYKFEFKTERSFKVGLTSFFYTPVGKVISAAIFLIVLLILASIFLA